MAVLETQELVIDIPGRADGAALTMTVAPGQCWGVLGPNGAGKTSLLHTLAGLRPPRRGRVRLDGVAVSDLRRRQLARQLAVVFQERQDSFPATVRETVLIGRHPYLTAWQRETGEDVRIASDALEALALSPLADRLVNTLSGGERQRVSIATALCQQPAVWLADEPTNHLDLHHQVAVMALLSEQARQGAGVFLCLHDLNLAARWCDHILLLFPDGELCHGPAEAMLVPDALERLYGQSLLVTEVKGRPFFIPE